MPHEVKLEQLPAGYAAESAHGAGEVAVWMRGFVSSDQGADFLTLIEGFPSEILQKLSDDRPVSPSTVDHMLVIIRRDKTATAYVNELQLVLEVQVTRSLKAGEPVFFGDIADVKRLKLGDVAVPADAAIVFVFSQAGARGTSLTLNHFAAKTGPMTWRDSVLSALPTLPSNTCSASPIRTGRG